MQRLRKAIFDVEAESKKILAEKRAGLKAGDEDVVNEISEKKDVMTILRTYRLPPSLMLNHSGICQILTFDCSPGKYGSFRG